MTDRDSSDENDATGTAKPAERATPRERTLKHLRGLVGAAAGAVIGCSGSQSSESNHGHGVVCDPLPPPSEDAGSEPDAPRPDVEGNDIDAGQAPVKPEEPPVVCDPLPPPMDDD